MLLVAFKIDILFQTPNFPVNSSPDKTGFLDFLQDALVFTFSSFDNRGEDIKPGAFREALNLVNNFLGRLGGYFPAAGWTVGNPCPGIQQAQVIVNFSYCPYRGAGVLGSTSLVNGNSGR